MNPDTGAIEDLVLDAVFDDGQHWIPVPLDVMLWDVADDTLRLNTDAATLQNAPFLQVDQIPVPANGEWTLDEYYQYWHSQPAGPGS